MGRWSLICASVKQRIEEVNVQARKLFLVSSRKGVDSDKIFHIFFAFQKTLSVESVQQFPKPSNLQRSDSGFNWNNEIHLIWWIEGGALTWITGVSSYFNLSCIILFTKPESLKYTLYPFGPQTFSLSLRNLWKLWPSGGRIYTATAQVWWFSIVSAANSSWTFWPIFDNENYALFLKCNFYFVPEFCWLSSIPEARLWSPSQQPHPPRGRFSVLICLPGTGVLLNSRQRWKPYSLTWQQIFLTPTGS